MNVKSILVPVDFSHDGDAAIEYAGLLARQFDAELHLVHVYEEPYACVDGGFASTPLPTVPPADLEAAKARLDGVRTVEGVRFRRKFILGMPAEELVNYANRNESDLVVMGTHGRTGLNRLVMGSVAEGVMRRAPCPVLTVKQPARELQQGN